MSFFSKICHLFLNHFRPPAEGGVEEELIIFLADPIQLDSTVPVPRLENSPGSNHGSNYGDRRDEEGDKHQASRLQVSRRG